MPLSLTEFVAGALAYEAAIRVWSGKARLWGNSNARLGPGGVRVSVNVRGTSPVSLRPEDIMAIYTVCVIHLAKGGVELFAVDGLANTERGHRLALAVKTCWLWNPLKPCGIHLRASIVSLLNLWFEASLAWMIQLSRRPKAVICKWNWSLLYLSVSPFSKTPNCCLWAFVPCCSCSCVQIFPRSLSAVYVWPSLGPGGRHQSI